MPSARVLGAFRDPARAAAAARELRRSGLEVRVAMAAPFAEVLQAVGRPPSSLGRVAFPAGLLGLAGGALLAAGSALAWPMVTGGKPIVSLPPLVIVAFELAILGASLGTFGALVAGVWRGRDAGAFPEAGGEGGDRIDVLAAGDAAVAEAVLRAAGAEEVRRVP